MIISGAKGKLELSSLEQLTKYTNTCADYFILISCFEIVLSKGFFYNNLYSLNDQS